MKQIYLVEYPLFLIQNFACVIFLKYMKKKNEKRTPQWHDRLKNEAAHTTPSGAPQLVMLPHLLYIGLKMSVA